MVHIDTEVIGTVEGLHAIRQDWDRLLEACPYSTPFQAYEWQVAWWKRFGQGRLMTLAMRVAGRLCGLAPLFVNNNGEVLFIGSGISDYLGVLLEPSIEIAGAEAVFNHLAGYGGWGLCRLQDTMPSCALLAVKPSYGFKSVIVPGEICLCADLPPSVEAFRKRHGRTGGCGSRKAWRRLSNKGLKVEAAGNEAEAVSFLETLFRLHSKKWEAAGKSGVLQDQEIRAFHAETALGFQKRGELRLYRMLFEGKELAVLYGFALKNRLYAYLMGYDPDFSKLSPGILMLLSVAEDCITRGIAGI
ncbi:MAG: GNAT family N-acetyltransferase, partial [Deltaproteobacteria bacterium]|nr:GNAT family N-acetyltransferase [Deltaproteobacteria bacterium]